MQLSDFDYELPQALIAQTPLAERSRSRLLVAQGGALRDAIFSDIEALVQPGDLLVLNNTKVVKARLRAQKDSGGAAELLLEQCLSEYVALCQVKVSKPLKNGRFLTLDDKRIECLGRVGQFYRLRFPAPVLQFLEAHGEIPLPPYIARAAAPSDEGRYQTVYAAQPGAVAAPTAGLHFDEELLTNVQNRGADIAEITLHVGAGTFAPVRNDLDAHEMHSEQLLVDEAAAVRVNDTKRAGGRIVAVGTTVVRALEGVASGHDGCLVPYRGATQLFIKPGFQFQIVDRLVTNFHLPKSTLFMLVCAFSGRDRVMQAYRHAVAERYRFFSYGDAMWLERDCV